MDRGERAEIEALDAQGRHTEAISALARATSAGDLGAMAELGGRLLVGDRGPCLPAQGSRFLFQAAQRGQPDAQERVAALLAGGVYVAQSWPSALRMLGLAAANGSRRARGQLSAMTGTIEPNGNWEALASQFDLAAWLGKPSIERVHRDASISRFPDLLPDPICTWLIDSSRGRLVRARVYDPIGRRETVSETRSNTTATFGIAEVTALHFLVQARMAVSCGVPLTHFEAPAVLHYDVGEQITPHFDFIDPRTPDYEQQVRAQGQRVFTFLIYLNDDYEGGETAFPELGIEHRGVRREGLLFANTDAGGHPDLRMLHAGKAPTRGEKWVLSQFIRRNPAR
jgi:prolyl 4-hydroxylase